MSLTEAVILNAEKAYKNMMRYTVEFYTGNVLWLRNSFNWTGEKETGLAWRQPYLFDWWLFSLSFKMSLVISSVCIHVIINNNLFFGNFSLPHSFVILLLDYGGEFRMASAFKGVYRGLYAGYDRDYSYMKHALLILWWCGLGYKRMENLPRHEICVLGWRSAERSPL